ncbi:MAG TPA: VUT family protein [Caldimonas sp.]|nr:VUT family protein [Caldimonas sp.]
MKWTEEGGDERPPTARERAPGILTGSGAVVCYVASIFLANWLLATYGIIAVGFGLHAPAGVFAAGLAFVFRDEVQDRLGVRWVVVAIVIGALASLLVAPTYAIASGVTFLVAEFADFAVYTPVRARSWIAAAVLSNTVGDLVDSALFLALAFGSLANIVGLIVGKWYATLPVLAVFAYQRWRETRGPERAA